MKWLALATLAACSSHTPPPSPPAVVEAPPAIATSLRCPGADARVIEHETDDGRSFTFELVLAGRAKPWSYDLGDLSSEQQFEVFSPDCRHALLLMSRYGPFHIVRVDHLRAYADGEPPEFVLAGERDPNGVSGTGVFRGGGWVSSREVDYTWGCCDPPITTSFVLPAD